MSNYFLDLQYATSIGKPHLAKDIYQRNQLLDAYEAGELNDEVAPLIDLARKTPIQNPGDFMAMFKNAAGPMLGGSDVSAIESLKASTFGDLDLSPLKKRAPANMDFSSAAEALTSGGQAGAEDEPDGFFMGNIKSAIESNVGFAKLMGGMLANGVGVESLGQALKASADLNFEQAEKYAKTESLEENPLAWAGQVLLQQIPEIGLTLAAGYVTGGAGWVAGFTGMLGKSTAKAAVRASLKSALTKGLAAKGVKEGAEAMVEAALKDEVVDSITRVGLRDAFLATGREAYAKNFAKAMGKEGIDLGEDVLKEAALKGARGRAIRSPGAFAAAGSLTYGVLTTDGDIAKDLYDEANRLRAVKVKQLTDSGMSEADAIEQAKKEISDPTLGDMGVAAFVAPMLDSVVTLSALKKVGALGGGSVTGFLNHVAAAEGGSAMLKSLPAAIIKNSLAEGTTEMFQGATSEYAKKVYMDKWEQITPEQKDTILDYLLRPEAKARYLAEFAGGALMGGVIGGITQKMENMGEKKAQTKAEAFHQALKDKLGRKVAEAKAAADAANVPEQTYSALTKAEVSRLFELANEDANMTSDTRVATLTAKKDEELAGVTDTAKRTEIANKYDAQIAELTKEPAKEKAVKPTKAEKKEKKAAAEDLNTQILDVDKQIQGLGPNDGVKRAELTNQKTELQGKLEELTNPKPKAPAPYAGPLKQRLDSLTAALATEKNVDTRLAIEEDLAKVQTEYDALQKKSAEMKSEVELLNEITALNKNAMGLSPESKAKAIDRVRAKLVDLKIAEATQAEVMGGQDEATQAPVDTLTHDDLKRVATDEDVKAFKKADPTSGLKVGTPFLDTDLVDSLPDGDYEWSQPNERIRILTKSGTDWRDDKKNPWGNNLLSTVGSKITRVNKPAAQATAPQPQATEDVNLPAQEPIMQEGVEGPARLRLNEKQTKVAPTTAPVVEQETELTRQEKRQTNAPFIDKFGFEPNAIPTEQRGKVLSDYNKYEDELRNPTKKANVIKSAKASGWVNNQGGFEGAVQHLLTKKKQGIFELTQGKGEFSKSTAQYSRPVNEQTGNIPETIDVDGVQRPTMNSKGQSIYPTLDGIKNFWRWFSNSEVVDDQGRPKVVYHGSSSGNIKDIDPTKPRGTNLFGPGFYTTEDVDIAGTYTKKKGSSIDFETLERYYTPGRRVGKPTKFAGGDEFFAGEFDIVEKFEAASEYSWTVTARDTKTGMLRTHNRKPNIDDVKRDAPDLISAANITPVYLKIVNPFNADVDTLGVNFVEDTINEYSRGIPEEDLARDRKDVVDNLMMKYGNSRSYTLDQIIDSLGVLDESADYIEYLRNILPTKLKELGYDGITHLGGIRVGNKEHVVWIATADPSIRGAQVKSATGNSGKFDSSNIDIRYKLPVNEQEVSKGTRVDTLISFLDSNTPGFLANANIQVVTSERFPEGGKDWQGAYENGTIYLNADTMDTADVKRILFHESLGHAVARDVLGKDYEPVMRTIMKEMSRSLAGKKDVMVGGTSLRDLLKTYEDKLYKNGKIDPLIAEEVWAKYIEAHAEGKLSDKNVLFKIFEAIRDFVIKSMGGEVRTLSAVDRLAARAVRFAEFNANGVNGEAQFSRANFKPVDINSKEFKAWFGNSKVVDENGNPMVVYHGTQGKFTDFKYGELGFHFGTKEAANDRLIGIRARRGMEDLPDIKDKLVANIIPAYVSIKNPIYINQDLQDWESAAEWRSSKYFRTELMNHPNDGSLKGDMFQFLRTDRTKGDEFVSSLKSIFKKHNVDGVIYPNNYEGDNNDNSYIALEPTQVKSAVSNTGNFSNENPDIRYARQVNKPRSQPVDERASKGGMRILGIKMPRMFEEVAILGEIESRLKTTDVNAFDKLLRPSQWISEKMFETVPQLRKMFMTLTEMSDRHREIFNQLSFNARPFLKASKADKIAVEKVLVQGDIDGVEHATAQAAGLNENQFKLYQSVRSALNNARSHMIADGKRAIAAMEERIKGQENLAPIITKQIKELKASIGALMNLKGYIPRVRPQNAPYDIQYMLDGKVHSEYIDIRGTPGIRAGERRIKELVAKGATPIGGADKIRVLERPANHYDQSSLNSKEIAELHNILSSVLKDKEGNALEGVDDLLKALFYAKGFSKHYIRRQKANLSKDGVEIATGSMETELDNGTSVIHGYQTENLDEVLRDYFQGLAGQSSKSETSLKLMDIFEERDAEGKQVFDPFNPKSSGAYDLGKQFLKAAKGAGNDYSKAVRWVNAIQFHAHIGLRFSSALWNMTHIHMFGSGLLRTEMMKAKMKNTPSLLDMSKQFVGAHKDAMMFIKAIKPKLETTADAKVTLSEMGWGQEKADLLDALNRYFAAANGSTLSEQLYAETFGRDAGVPKSMLAQYTKWSGWMMHHSELSNKLASFQMHYQNMGQNFDEAKHFVRLLNGSYEKFNMPGYLQGEGLASSAAQIMLNSFRTHVLNTYENMGSMWKYNKVAFAYSMAAATIMAGVPGKLALDMLIRLIWGVSEGEDQFKGSYERMNEDLFGTSLAKFIKGGIANWLDFVDTSASIGISQHPAVDALSYLTGHGREIALAAPVIGFIKAMTGEAPAYKLMPIKGIQSIFQAFSDSDQLQVGSRKIFNPDGTPMKLAMWESSLVALGLNPARRSGASSQIWEDYQVNDYFNSWKSNTVEAMQDARTVYEKIDAGKQAQEFNKSLMEVKRNPAYSGVVKTKPVSPADAKRTTKGEKTLSREL
jgi:hypothetical protein